MPTPRARVTTRRAAHSDKEPGYFCRSDLASAARPCRQSEPHSLRNCCRRRRTKLRTSAKVGTGDEPGLQPVSGKNHRSDHMILRRSGKRVCGDQQNQLWQTKKVTSPPAVPCLYPRAVWAAESMPESCCRLASCTNPFRRTHASAQRSGGPSEDKMRYALKTLRCSPLPGASRVATAVGIHAPRLPALLCERRLRQEPYDRSATFPLPIPPMRTFRPGRWLTKITG